MPKTVKPLSPELTFEARQFADTLKARFTPPEFIPGCEVKSVSDKDEYTTDNGWIEAVCGHHNQQRVRYKGYPPNVGTADYIDVLYFQDRRLFEAYGAGGTAAPPTFGGGYPFGAETVDPSDTDADHSTIAGGLAAISSGGWVQVAQGDYNESLTLGTAVYLQGLQRESCVIQQQLTITTASVVEDFKLTGSGFGAYIQTTAGALLRNVTTLSSAADDYAYGIQCDVSATLENCDVTISGGTVANFAAYVAAGTVTIERGRYDASGTGAVDLQIDSGAHAVLRGPILANTDPAGSGTWEGWYFDGDGGIHSPWSTFTPTLTQSGAVTKTVNFARYKIIGKVCHLEIYLTATGAGTGGNAIEVGNLPAEAQPVASNTITPLGIASVFDSGSAFYFGFAFSKSAAPAVLQLRDNNTTNFIGVNPNFALASGDAISVNCTYEVS